MSDEKDVDIRYACYCLYGEPLITNDDTFDDFAKCIVKNVTTDDPDEIDDILSTIIEDDLPRTNIDYSSLLVKFAKEIGPILYYMDNTGYDLNGIEIAFFNQYKSQKFFNFMLEVYCRALLNDKDELERCINGKWVE